MQLTRVSDLNSFSSSEFISMYRLLTLSTKKGCLVMRIRQLMLHSKLPKIKEEFSQIVCKEAIETVREKLATRHVAFGI